MAATLTFFVGLALLRWRVELARAAAGVELGIGSVGRKVAARSRPWAPVLAGVGLLLIGALSVALRGTQQPGRAGAEIPVPTGRRERVATGIGRKTWSYPNLHGDSILAADATGVRIGARATYDPFGQSIDPVAGSIGTTTADDAIAETSPGEADYGYSRARL